MSGLAQPLILLARAPGHVRIHGRPLLRSAPALYTADPVRPVHAALHRRSGLLGEIHAVLPVRLACIVHGGARRVVVVEDTAVEISLGSVRFKQRLGMASDREALFPVLTGDVAAQRPAGPREETEPTFLVAQA